MCTVPFQPMSFSRRIMAGACVLGLGFATASYSQDLGAAIQDTTAPPSATTPLQRGLGESIRSGAEGGTLGDSLRSGLGEAARSASESPAETAQRDQINQLQGQSQPQAIVRSNAAGQWKQNRQGPTLGVAIESTDQGVRVLDVRPGSAAEKAGIQRGDVITAVNGQNISSPQALVQSIGSANGQVDMAIMRNGQSTQMTAMLDASQDMQRVAKPAIEGESEAAGLAGDFAQLQSQMAELQQELQALRQEVMNLKTSKGTQTETLNNTPATSLDEEPADPFSESPAPADDNVDDLFNNETDAAANDDAAKLE